MNYHYLGYRIDSARYPRLEEYFRRSCGLPSITAALRAEQPVAQIMGLDFGAIDALAAEHAQRPSAAGAATDHRPIASA